MKYKPKHPFFFQDGVRILTERLRKQTFNLRRYILGVYV
jgi:hypothetical protein